MFMEVALLPCSSLPIFLESILIDLTVALAYKGKKVNVLGFHVNNPRCP